jgi:hypothetical protein
VADLAASPLITLVKEGKVDLVINAAPPGKSSQPCE